MGNGVCQECGTTFFVEVMVCPYCESTDIVEVEE